MKGKLKAKLALMLASLLTFSALVSCSSDTTTEKPKEEENKVVEEVPETPSSKYLPLGEDPYADDALKVQEALLDWNFVNFDEKKTVYLTFDDGPSSKVTGEILDVLKEKDVKATFFVLGNMVDKNKKSQEALMRMADEGHAIANHGYSHDYSALYPNDTVDVQAFMSDMDKSLNSMKAVLGPDFNTRVIRFPGGHSNWYTGDIDKHLAENNYAFVDWNALNNDAAGESLTADQAFENLKTTIHDIDTNNDMLVVLMHDTDNNLSNPEYLGKAIDYLRELGYEFRTLK